MATACPWTPSQGMGIMLEIVGSILVLALWSSPVSAMLTGKESVLRTRSTERLATGFPFAASMFNCALWVIWGLDKLDTLLEPTLINAAGFLLNVVFVAEFFVFSVGDKRKTFVFQTLAIGIIFIVGCILLVTVGSEPVGYIADVITVIMLFAPLAAAGQVIRNRSTKGMLFLPLVFVLTSSLVWMAFGINLCNVTIALPNGLGVIFGIMQLSLYFWARSVETAGEAAGVGMVAPYQRAFSGPIESDSLVTTQVPADLENGIDHNP